MTEPITYHDDGHTASVVLVDETAISGAER